MQQLRPLLLYMCKSQCVHNMLQSGPDACSKLVMFACRYDDMVGHSQLDSDMLQDFSAEPAADEDYEVPKIRASDEKALEGPREQPSPGNLQQGDMEEPLSHAAPRLPQSGCKRKRISPQDQHVQDAILVSHLPMQLCNGICINY